MTRAGGLGLLLLCAMAPAAGAQETAVAVVRAGLTSARLPSARWPDFPRMVDDAARLYGAEPDSLVWFADGRLIPQAAAAVQQLVEAERDGLHPADYDAARLDSLRASADTAAPALRGEFDLLLSVDLLRYLRDLRAGRTGRPPLSAAAAARADSARIDLPTALRQAIGGDSIARLVAAVTPQLTQYRNLRIALARYRRLAADSSLPLAPRPGRLPIRPGDHYSGAPLLRDRLAALGDLPAGSGPTDAHYTGPLVDAVARFQVRHGLAPDSVLGPATFAALNTPLSDRVRQLELALERLRWLPPLGHQRFIVVNVPAFQLYAFDSAGEPGRSALQMRVIVGRALETRTPMLYEAMRYVEFRPYWNVPRSILVNEILPQLRRNPGYLAANDMEAVGPGDRIVGTSGSPAIIAGLRSGEYRVRQRPGPRNALGLIKFVFPNAASVYLHGTPNPELFARTRRDFSHGCIRLEEPAALGAWVLRDEGWTEDSVRSAMDDGTRRVLLSRPLPVIVFYTTAVVRSDGTVWFYPDLYGHDARLDEALRAESNPP